MDKNQATGLILISLLLLVYFYFFAPKTIPDEQPTTSEPEFIDDQGVQDSFIPLPSEIDQAPVSNTSDEWAKSIKRLVDDEKLSGRISQKAFEDSKKYNWQTRAQKISQFLLK